MDALASLLDGPRARGAFLLRSVLDPPWSVRIQDEAPLTLVSMVRGGGWVLPHRGEPVRLRPGDIAVLRGPDPYTMADDPATPPQAVIHPGQYSTTPDGDELCEVMNLGTRSWGDRPDGSVVVISGTYQMRGEVSQRLLSALPPLLVLRHESWDSPLVALLDHEIGKDEPGQDVVLDRLLDLLLIAVLRCWFSRPEAEAPGWYRAQSDPVVGRALRMLHNNPAHPWTVAVAGRRDRGLPGRARPPLPRPGRRAADDVPRRLAARARRRPAARAGRHGRRGRQAGRLRQPVRAVQPHSNGSAGSARRSTG